MSQASSSKICKYDVFLSFRGEDTRRTFVSHLDNVLEQRGIHTFKDDKRLKAGESISDELLKAIEEARYAIVIFSKSYASSKWCLEELAHIIKCKNELELIVIPVFYDVSPSDVRHQNPPFAESFSQHEERYKDDMAKVQRWRDAFVEVGKISGYHLQNFKDDADCIKKIVDDIFPKLLQVVSYLSESLVGMKSQVEKVISLLDMQSNDVRSVGICGMSGIGKTEIARNIYQRYRHRFEADCLLGDVGTFYHENGVTWLAQVVICKLLGEKITLTSKYEGVNILRNMLRQKKVLFILDDVNHREQLEFLVGGPEWFGKGSRIIITARDKNLLITHVGDNVYEVQLLSEDEARELFCMHAFKRKSPVRDFEELSSEVVKYADGLPLALKVLGSSVCGRTKQQWRDTIDTLKKIPNDDILGKLKIGLDRLNKDEMRAFLDIACFFNHNSRLYVERILKSCGICMIGIDHLIEKSLLSTRDWSLEMHSLISQMGQNVSREEYTNNRIWLIEEVHDLFAGKLKAKKVESLRIPNYYRFEDDDINYSEVFKKMLSLQVLIVDEKTICSENTVTCLPSSLRWIDWTDYPSSSLPEKFKPSHLVGLHLNRSRLVELWPIPKKLNNLKYLDLRKSLGLTETPNFDDMPILETLILEGCQNLEEVHPSLGHCRMLTYLNLSHCNKLKKLPKFVTMGSLETLELDDCTSLEEFPEICGDMRRLSTLRLGSHWITSLPTSLSCLSHLILSDCKVLGSIPDTIRNLEHLDISGCNKLATLPNSLFESQQLKHLEICVCSGLVELPISLGVQKKLVCLDLGGCENLMKLPNSIQMESLEELHICNCPKLDTFPEINGDMNCLNILRLHSIGIRGLPSSIGNLSSLTELYLCDCKKLEKLPDSIQMESLEVLQISHCPKLDTFPEINGDMNCLNILRLNSIGIRGLPSSIWNLSSLTKLYLCDCKKLEKLPDSIQMESLEVLQISHCPKLDTFPEINGDMNCLNILRLNSIGIRGLPSSIWNLSSLTKLYLCDCKKLEKLPDSIQMESLEVLQISHCPKLDTFPEINGDMNCLNILRLNSIGIRGLPSSIWNLSSLTKLYLCDCKKLEKLPDSIQMESLEELDISNCPKLDTFPEINGDMNCLNKLTLNSIGIRGLPSSIGNLSSLAELDLEGCEGLVSLPNSLCNLKDLQRLCLYGCKKLEKLPENIGDLQELEILDARESAISQPPPSITNLVNLEELMFSHVVKHVQHSSTSCFRQLSALSYLRELHLRNVNILGGLPEDLGSLDFLEKLNVSGSNISCLPESIKELLHLTYLNVQFCQNLNELPGELPPNLTKLAADYPLALKSVRGPVIKCLKLSTLSISWPSHECRTLSSGQVNVLKLVDHFLRTCIQYRGQKDYLLISFPVVIPALFDYQFINQKKMSIDLNPSWYTDKFMGFWICYYSVIKVVLAATLVCKSDPQRKHSLKCDIFEAPECPSNTLLYVYIPFETMWHRTNLYGGNNEGKNPNDYYRFEISLDLAASVQPLGIELVYEKEMDSIPFQPLEKYVRKRKRGTENTDYCNLLPETFSFLSHAFS